MGQSLKNLSLDEITERLSNAHSSGDSYAHLMAELTRRQTIAQIEAAEATKTNAVWMFWAVVAAAVSAVVTALGVAFSAFGHH
jgi:hypothetical protein